MDIVIDTYILSAYHNDLDNISLGYDMIDAYKFLSEDDFITFLSDTITHEYIHYILHQLFDITTCKLFDAIAHFTRDENILFDVFKYIRDKENTSIPETWHEFILRDGFNAFLNYYWISDDEVKTAKETCNRR